MRPISLRADKEGDVPREFLMEVMELGISSGDVFLGEAESGEVVRDDQGRSQKARISMIASEELAWGDPALIISFPGPGLGAPPVKILGTPEQKKRFFEIFKTNQSLDGEPMRLLSPGPARMLRQ